MLASVEAVLDPLLTSKGFPATQDSGNSADESTDITGAPHTTDSSTDAATLPPLLVPPDEARHGSRSR